MSMLDQQNQEMLLVLFVYSSSQLWAWLILISSQDDGLFIESSSNFGGLRTWFWHWVRVVTETKSLNACRYSQQLVRTDSRTKHPETMDHSAFYQILTDHWRMIFEWFPMISHDFPWFPIDFAPFFPGQKGRCSSSSVSGPSPMATCRRVPCWSSDLMRPWAKLGLNHGETVKPMDDMDAISCQRNRDFRNLLCLGI